MASIRDVAKLAQVAPSTVSLVLNNKGYVSKTARDKVLAAIKELNYVPNELARNLFRNCTNIIGVVVPDIAHPFFGTFIRFLEIALYKQGYKILVCSTIERQNGEHEFVDMLKRQIIDGIIMGCHSLEVDLYKEIDKPIVALDRVINDNIPIIRSDHELGGKLAAQRLIKAQVKHPLQLFGSRKVNTPAHIHHLSFTEEMNKHNISVSKYELDWNKFNMEYFKQVAHKILQKDEKIDAIYGADMLACAFLGEAHKRKINVPEDLKIIAYDGTFITECGSYSITSIVQPIEKLAQTTAKMIVKLIKGINVDKEIILPVTLHEGETC